MDNINQKLLVIDNHSHVTFPLEDHIHLMDEAGINKTILFRTLVHPEKTKNLYELRKEMNQLNSILNGNVSLAQLKAKDAETELLTAIERYPDRFIGFGAIPLSFNTVQMVEYIEKELLAKGLVGIGEFTLASDSIYLLENVFKASSKTKNIPLWIHTLNPLILKDIQEIEIMAQKYPSVPVILGHMGGMNWLEAIDIVKNTTNIYIDTSANYSTLALKTVIEELPDKTLFGVDYPYGNILLSRITIEEVCKNKDVLAKVLGGNIQKLLKID